MWNEVPEHMIVEKGKNQFWFPLEEHRVLFVDNLHVAKLERLTRTLHQPKQHPRNPIISGDMPWETQYVILFGTVLRDPIDGLFKAWYHMGPNRPEGVGHREGKLYAFSEDGLEWKKPVFDMFPRNGQPTNIFYRGFDPKLVESGDFNLDKISIMITPEDPDPARRYKLFTFQAPISAKAKKPGIPNAYGYYTACSEDGIHWVPRPDPVISLVDDPNMSDCNTCMYDPLKNRYIAFTKQHLVRPDGTGDQGIIQRVRAVSFSEDFEHWTKPQACLVPDDFDDRDTNFYNQSGFVYEGMYIGLLEIYHSSDDHPGKARTRDVQLISSRDGEHWWRAGGRQSFLTISNTVGAWDAFLLDINTAGPIPMDDELWFYYGGRERHHVPENTTFPEDRQRGGIGLGILRRDGFVSLDAGTEGGRMTTKPIRFEQGSSLHVNAEIKGDLTVEVLEITEQDAPPTEPAWRLNLGDPFDGFTRADCQIITGDNLDAVIGFAGGSLDRFQGKLIAFRFHLNHGSLYSFWME